jgi:hypothetical protein
MPCFITDLLYYFVNKNPDNLKIIQQFVNTQIPQIPQIPMTPLQINTEVTDLDTFTRNGLRIETSSEWYEKTHWEPIKDNIKIYLFGEIDCYKTYYSTLQEAIDAFKQASQKCKVGGFIKTQRGYQLRKGTNFRLQDRARIHERAYRIIN